MKVHETKIGGVAVTALSGRIDSASAAACEAELARLLQDGRTAMVIDMAEVDYLSSAGIRALVMLYKRAVARDIPLVLARTQEHIREILEIAGLTEELPVHSDIDAALRAVA